MAGEVAPWNLLQIAMIAMYPAYASFTRMPSGMSLVALYLFLLILCVPPMFIQLKLGNYLQRGIVGLLSNYFPLAKGVGITLLIQLFLVCVYMAPLVTHYGVYALISVLKVPYVWGSCDNFWNSEKFCFDNSKEEKIEDKLNIRKFITAEEQFFDNQYLQITNSIEEVKGFPIWGFSDVFTKVGSQVSLMPVAMVITWLMVFLFIAFGARVCGWILFVLGPAFLALMFVVMGYGYSNLDRQSANSFLADLYNLDLNIFNDISGNEKLIQDWTAGFVLGMYSLPVWTAILPTMGKLTGQGKLSRNLSWLVIMLVYALTCQLPQLTMAPYLGNLRDTVPEVIYRIKGLDVPFKTMAAAFSQLEIPPQYAMLFYLSIFIAGLMFLSVAMFTILDNLVEALTDWVEALQDRKLCVNFCGAFALVAIAVGAGLLHTTKAGLYYIILMDQCLLKMFFITVALHGFSIIVIYVRQKFAIAERIIMGIWCGCATITASAFFLYFFIDSLDKVPGYNNVRIPETWDLVCWVFASAPFLAIPAAAIHSFQRAEGLCEERLKYVMCGHDSDEYDPNHPECEYHRAPVVPTAPPYGNADPDHHTYVYSYPMQDVPYNKQEPERQRLMDTRI